MENFTKGYECTYNVRKHSSNCWDCCVYDWYDCTYNRYPDKKEIDIKKAALPTKVVLLSLRNN